MKINRNRACVACLLTVATFVPALAAASSAMAPGERAAAVSAAKSATEGFRLQSGHVSAFDLQRGLLVVDGQVYRINPRQAAFSDDRAKPAEKGLAELRPGDKVIVRSQKTSGSPQVIQLVVKD